jgi:hypothetical protein
MALWLLSRASGDFGTSPFFEQLSGKSFLTRIYVCGVRGSKHNSASRNKFAVGGMASTYARLMSPPGGESFMGLRSVRFNSELHGRVRVVCLFCTREPSCSHLAPCGLFVSAPGTRHAYALGGMAPKFFRWIHCGTSSKQAPALSDKFKASFTVPAFSK